MSDKWREEIEGLYQFARDTKFHLTGGSLAQLRDIALRLASEVERLEAEELRLNQRYLALLADFTAMKEQRDEARRWTTEHAHCADPCHTPPWRKP